MISVSEPRLGLYGRLQIFENGNLVFDDHNTIVQVGKLALLGLFAGDTTVYMGQMAIGNGSEPVQVPTIDDTAMVGQIDVKNIATYTIDSTNRIVLFECSFNSSDYTSGDFPPNGGESEEVNEAGLLMNNDVLFARKTFSARPFAIGDNVTLTFRWSVGII